MESSEPAVGTTEAVAFRLPFSVPESDIDVLGHASNIAYVRWVQDVAVAHSNAVGLTWEAYQALGAVFVVRRHEIDYLRSLQFGDPVEATTWIQDVKGVQCDRMIEFRTGDVVVAKSRTLWVFMSFERQRPVRIPEPIRIAFGFPTAQESAQSDT